VTINHTTISGNSAKPGVHGKAGLGGNAGSGAPGGGTKGANGTSPISDGPATYRSPGGAIQNLGKIEVS